MRTSLLKKLRKKFYSGYTIQPQESSSHNTPSRELQFLIYRYDKSEHNWRWTRRFTTSLEEAEKYVRAEVRKDILMWLDTEKCKKHRWLW